MIEIDGEYFQDPSDIALSEITIEAETLFLKMQEIKRQFKEAQTQSQKVEQKILHYLHQST